MQIIFQVKLKVVIKMKNQNLQFCNETIHPGESLSLALPLPELFSCAPLYMPIKIVHGKKQGPCVLITAAMHGNEFNGTEIINRLVSLNSMKQLSGTLIAVPVMNVYGLMNRSRHLHNGIELDRCFPGSKSGTHAARMAHLFTKQVFSKADVCIDLQTGFLNHTNLPQVYIGADHEKILAEAFNAPVISKALLEKGTLRFLANKHRKPFISYVAGEAMRLDEHAIKVGVSGMLNVLRQLQMLPSLKKHKSDKAKKLKNFYTEKNLWVRASTSGVSHTKHKLGQSVKKGEALCIIKDPFGATENEIVYAPEDAVIVGKNNLPLVHEGERLFQLAVFSSMQHAASHLEDWKDKSTEQLQKTE